MRAGVTVLALAIVVCAAAGAAVAQPEPSGPHPRLFLDAATRAAWKQQANQGGAVATAIARCAATPKGGEEYDHDRYMGFTWSMNLQACLIAWVATGDDTDAAYAIKYFTALLDDLELPGDGKGGDTTIRRDHGYAIRLIGPTTALAYDWLHDHKLMTDALRKKALGRFKAWLDWYQDNGYRPRSPGTNYQAGYLVAATLIAIAQGGEAGDYGATLWKYVRDELWGKDMTAALAGPPLDGGDWSEGWQYGPLSVGGYALAGRAMTAAGVDVKGYRDWLTALVVRHVYGLAPDGGTFVGGDVEDETPNIEVSPLPLLAVLVGESSDEARGWAAAELAHAKIKVPDEFRVYEALADARAAKPVDVPRKDWPTWYLAKGSGNLYARTSWGPDAVWTVMQCTSTIDIDHFHADAGNVVLSRGVDDVIADPSPYGTLSTMTSNAPSVESAHLPDTYKPGQAFWSKATRWEWAHQTARGVVVARCDYADQYKFQDRPSDVPAALRDMVVVPWNDGRDASLVVIDRAKSGAAGRNLFLRFRTPGTLVLAGADTATATVGGTALAISRLASSSGAPTVTTPTKKNCFDDSVTRGNCDAARFPVTDFRLVVNGPEMSAVDIIDATAAGGTPTAKLLTGTGWSGAWLERKDGAALVVYAIGAPGKTLDYQAPATAAVHVVLDAPADATGRATVTATAKDGQCAISIAPGGMTAARPAVFAVDAKCVVTADTVLTGGPTLGGAAASTVTDDGRPTYGSGYPTRRDPGPRTGCCGAQASPGPSIVLSLLVLGLLVRRRASDPEP